MRARIRPVLLLLVVCTPLLLPAPGRAQAAAGVAPSDPVYVDLERLEAFGLVPAGVSSQRPLSVGRLTWLATEARRSWQANGDGLATAVRADLEALLQRVERRLKIGAGATMSGVAEVEAGGGRSPGRWFPERDNDGGRVVDAVSNPLWSDLGGRSYGDRATVALAARVDLGAGAGAGFSVGGRTAWWDASGPVGGRGRNTVEVASGRFVLGPMSLEVGRNAAVWGRTGIRPLLLSQNGVPLDLVRVATDRPLSVPVLGEVDVTVFLADLGPRQHFPHAKEFGFRLDARPTRAVTLGFSALNKQGGEGAPEATLRRRLWDATVFGPAIFGDDGLPFSDKLLGADLRWTLSAATGLEVTAAAILTDFEKNRITDILDVAAGYRAGIHLPRLGDSQRHSLALDGQRTGVFVYRHFQFRSGLATEHLLQGSMVGPDARSATLRYAYDDPRAGTRLEVEGQLEDRSADTYGNRFDPYRDVYKTEDLPDEVRSRLQVSLMRWMGPGTLQIRGGVEHVRNPSYPEAGPSRTNVALLVQFRRAF